MTKALRPTKGVSLQLIHRTPIANVFKVPPLPKHLPKTMQREWAQACRNQHAEGLWHDDRLHLLAAYFQQVHHARQAAEVLDTHGLFDANGKPHPAQAASRSAAAAMVSLARALGLTVPSGSTASPKDADPAKPAAPTNSWAAATAQR
jgi:phage terminase small subunit